MRRLLTSFILLLTAASVALGQVKERNIKVWGTQKRRQFEMLMKSKRSETEKLEEAKKYNDIEILTEGLVVGFDSESQRQQFLRGVKDIGDIYERLGNNPTPGHGWASLGIITAEGYVKGVERYETSDAAFKRIPFRLSNDGCILVVADFIPIGLQYQCGTVFDLQSSPEVVVVYDGGLKGGGVAPVTVNGEFYSKDTTEIEQVTIQGKREYKKKHKADQTSTRTTEFKLFKYQYAIPSEMVKSDSRITGVPLVVEVDEDEDSVLRRFAILHPSVLDGENYHLNQMKRMGYDVVKNDVLGSYVEMERCMHDGVADTLCFSDTIRKVRDRFHYPVWLKLQYRNHAGVYEETEFQADDGRDMEPLRFVDFQDSTVRINHACYSKRRTTRKSNDKMSVNIPFAVNQSTLRPDDEAGWAEIHKAREALASYTDGSEGKELTGFTIQGFASPEGSEQHNLELARGRAQFFMNELVRGSTFMHRYAKMLEPKIQPWEVVADTLQDLGYLAEAQQVRDICNAHPGNMQAQYAAIRQLDCYSTLINNRDSVDVLGRLRVDIMQIEYIVEKVMTLDDTYADYLDNPEKFTSGRAQDYQYYLLFTKLENDPKRLLPLAKAAMRFNDDFNERRNRPWTLAAYYYATCRAQLNDNDSTILYNPLSPDRSFIRFDADINTDIPPEGISAREWGDQARVPYNDLAIVMAQIRILCNMHRFDRARYVFNQFLSAEAYPMLDLFLSCYETPDQCYEDENIDKIAATSDWNRMAIYAAQPWRLDGSTRKWHQMAYNMLADTTMFSRNNPRVNYLLALMRFRIEGRDDIQEKDTKEIKTIYFREGYTEQDPLDPDRDVLRDWGAPMIKAIKQQPDLLKTLKWDGYFPKAYYEAVVKYLEQEKARQTHKTSAEETTQNTHTQRE